LRKQERTLQAVNCQLAILLISGRCSPPNLTGNVS
jgi:hypothetical protein